jgi:hypothetical protein
MLNKKSKKAMKNQSENLMAATAAYVAPAVEVLEVSVEKGFAQSDNSNPSHFGSNINWGGDDDQ